MTRTLRTSRRFAPSVPALLSVPLLAVSIAVVALSASTSESAAVGPNEVNLQIVARIGGESRAVAADGQRALLAEGDFVVAIDASAPTAPRVVGRAELRGPINDIVLERNVGYVAAKHGLTVLDATDLRAMRVLADRDVGQAYAVAVEGNRAYVAASASEAPYDPDECVLHVFDVADPANPVELGGVWGYTAWYGLAVMNGFVWLPQVGAGMAVVDARDPTAMVEVARVGEEGGVRGAYCLDIDRAQQRVILAALEYPPPGTRPSQGVVIVFDGTDPAAPRILGTASRRATSAGDCAFDDGYFHVAQGNDGVETHVVDASGVPSRVRHLPAYATVMAVDSSFGVTYAVDTLTRWDVGDGRKAPGLRLYRDGRETGELATTSYAVDVAVAGDTVYVATAPITLVAYDVSVPESPRHLGALAETSNAASFLALDLEVDRAAGANLALVASGSGGVRIYDVTDTARMRVVGSFEPGVDVLKVASRAGAGVALAQLAGGAGVSVFTLGDPSAPSERARVEGRANDIGFDGELAMVAGDGPALRWLDLTEPEAPVVVGEIPGSGSSQGLAVTDAEAGLALLVQSVPGSAFIPTPPPTPEGPPTAGPSPTPTPLATAPPDGSRLVVVDASDPRSPRIVSSSPGEQARHSSVVFHRDRAYVGPSAWYAYDVSDPPDLRRLSLLVDGEPAYTTEFHYAAGYGELLLIAAGESGVLIARPIGADESNATATASAGAAASATAGADPTVTPGTATTPGPSPSATPTFVTWTPQRPTPTASATSTARGPGTLPPQYFTMTAEAGATQTSAAGATQTAVAGNGWRVFVPVAERGG